MSKKIVDVSTFQGRINWEEAKKHIDGVILRCGYGDNISSQDDEQWERNVRECERLGIPYGVYIYSYATSMAQIESEAQHVLRLIAGRKLSYPVYLDLEESGTEAGAIERANRFGDIIEAAGYWCGIYANLSWWRNHLVGLERFTKWVAQYNSTCDYNGKCDMWQYSSQGSVPGIGNGNVDMNICWRDFPAEIFGNVPVSPNPKPEKSIEEIAKEVLEGIWGNGEDRRKRLAAAGYDYDAVQNRVNELLGNNKKPIEAIVQEVLNGVWGNGEERRNRLISAGYNYDEVQSKINTMMETPEYYEIQSGDTLSGIASKYGTTYQKLASMNGIPNPDMIHAGDVIRVK